MPTLELHQLLGAHVTWKDFTEPLRFFAVSTHNKWSDIKKHMHFFSQLLDASHGRVPCQVRLHAQLRGWIATQNKSWATRDSERGAYNFYYALMCLSARKRTCGGRAPVRYEILQTLMDKIKGDEGNETAEFKENGDNNDSEKGCEKAGSSDSCCGLEVVEVERKLCVEISSDSESGTPRGRRELIVASLDALDMLLFPSAGTPTPKRQRFSEQSSPATLLDPRASPATLPDPCALLDDTAMDNSVNDCMAAPTPRDYMKFAESKGNNKAKPIKSGNKSKDTKVTLQDKEPMANENVSKAGKGTAKIGETGSKLHVTNVKIGDLIAPYLGIHDVDFRVVEKRVHSRVYHAVRSELESFLPVF